MSSRRVHPIVRSALSACLAVASLDGLVPARGAAADSIELPDYKGTLKDDYYPTDARQHYLQGRALVEFSLNARGVPTHVAVVAYEPTREFEESARHLVQNLRFEVPLAPQASAVPAPRFRLGVRYQVIECINFSKCESTPRNPPADYDTANRTYIVSMQRRVLSFASKSAESQAAPAGNTPAAAPAAVPTAPPPPAGTAAPAAAPAPPAPRSRDTSPALPEPNYPPG